MEEALEYAREKLGYDSYVEESTLVSLMQANYVMETQIQEEEITKLTIKNAELTMELTQSYLKLMISRQN